MSKRTRAENRAKRDAARASQHPFKRPHPDPWKRLPPAGAEVDGSGVVKAVLHAAPPAAPGVPEPVVLEHPGVLAGPHFTDAQGVVRAIEDDPVGALSEMLRVAGARVTIDPRASNAEPCWRCGTTAEPRGLEVIGVYARWMGGNLEPGDKIRRPLCGACNEATQAGDGGDLSHAEALAELAEERRLRERLTAICERTVLALRGPHPEGAIWGWHDLPELAAAAAVTARPPFDLDLFVEAFLSVIDEEPGDIDESYVGAYGEICTRHTVLGRMARRAGVTTPKAVFERVLVVYDAWRAARPTP